MYSTHTAHKNTFKKSRQQLHLNHTYELLDEKKKT